MGTSFFGYTVLTTTVKVLKSEQGVDFKVGKKNENSRLVLNKPFIKSEYVQQLALMATKCGQVGVLLTLLS